MDKERGIRIVGAGKIGKIAVNDTLSSIMLGEVTKLKECHKTEQYKNQEKLQITNQNLPNGFIEEYELIQQKKSKLSRAKRDYIVREVEKYFSK